MTHPDKTNPDLVGKILNGKWRIGPRLGGGSFGEIYIAQHLETLEECAVKIEPKNTKHPQLIYEAKIVKYISGAEGVCPLLFAFSDTNYNYMGIERLGPSLETVFNKNGRRFSTKTICMIAIQMLTRAEMLHNKNFIHRDIKPDNFLIGIAERAETIYMIDFGLAKRYKHPKTLQHIPYREDKSLTGTARYASLRAHKGIEQSRRDDLEAIGLVLMYFVRKGSLPWQGIRAEKKHDKYKLIEEKKESTTIRSLCKGSAPAFAMYLHYVRGLKFDKRPDYEYMRGLFLDLLLGMGQKNDGKFDWVDTSEKSRSTVNAADVIERDVIIESKERIDISHQNDVNTTNDDPAHIAAPDYDHTTENGRHYVPEVPQKPKINSLPRQRRYSSVSPVPVAGMPGPHRKQQAPVDTTVTKCGCFPTRKKNVV